MFFSIKIARDSVFFCIVLMSFIGMRDSKAEVFSSEPRTFSKSPLEGTVRGVVNVVSLPVPDQMELGQTQSGYFLFTPYPCTIKTKEAGVPLCETNQQMFQLAPSDKQVELLKSLLGKPVELEVLMFPMHTRYHRTPILFQIKSAKAINTVQ